jgi:hypothetical protein
MTFHLKYPCNFWVWHSFFKFENISFMLRNDGIGSKDCRDNKRTMGDNENNGTTPMDIKGKKNSSDNEMLGKCQGLSGH